MSKCRQCDYFKKLVEPLRISTSPIAPPLDPFDRLLVNLTDENIRLKQNIKELSEKHDRLELDYHRTHKRYKDEIETSQWLKNKITKAEEREHTLTNRISFLEFRAIERKED